MVMLEKIQSLARSSPMKVPPILEEFKKRGLL
jgi:hypothetical protein